MLVLSINSYSMYGTSNSYYPRLRIFNFDVRVCGCHKYIMKYSFRFFKIWFCNFFCTHSAKSIEKSIFRFLFFELWIVFIIYGDTPGFSRMSPTKKEIVQKWSNFPGRYTMSWDAQWDAQSIIQFLDIVDFVLKFRN